MRVTASNVWKVYNAIYVKLKSAMAEHANEPDPVASVEVLGETGTWLSSLTDYELSLVMQQVSGEIRRRAHANYEI